MNDISMMSRTVVRKSDGPRGSGESWNADEGSDTALRKTGVAVHVVAVTRYGMAARQHEALLARRVGPVAEGAELNVHERALLDALALAHETGDFKPLDRWAGWLEAGRTAERLRRRQEAAARGGGWIDGFDTHVAITLDAGSV